MKIEDDLQLHSHYIEELFDSQDKQDASIEMIRARTHEMKEKLGMHGYAIEALSGDIIKVLENHKEIVKVNNETRELIDKINNDTYRRFQPIEFIREILGSPLSCLRLVGLIVTIEVTMGLSDVLKHFLRLY